MTPEESLQARKERILSPQSTWSSRLIDGLGRLCKHSKWIVECVECEAEMLKSAQITVVEIKQKAQLVDGGISIRYVRD